MGNIITRRLFEEVHQTKGNMITLPHAPIAIFLDFNRNIATYYCCCATVYDVVIISEPMDRNGRSRTWWEHFIGEEYVKLWPFFFVKNNKETTYITDASFIFYTNRSDSNILYQLFGSVTSSMLEYAVYPPISGCHIKFNYEDTFERTKKLPFYDYIEDEETKVRYKIENINKALKCQGEFSSDIEWLTDDFFLIIRATNPLKGHEDIHTFTATILPELPMSKDRKTDHIPFKTEFDDMLTPIDCFERNKTLRDAYKKAIQRKYLFI